MHYAQLALFVIGAIVLVLGYRRNRRNLLLLAAILLLLAGSLDELNDFAHGFSDGLQQGYSTTRSSSPAG